MSQSPTSVVPVRGRQPSGGSSRGGARRALEARRAPVIATAPGSGDRDLKRWVVAASSGDCLELGHLPADDVPRAVLKPSGKASAPCLHRSRGRCLLSWQTGRRAWPGGGAIPASTHEPDNPDTHLVSCQSDPLWSSPRRPQIVRSVGARPKHPGDPPPRYLPRPGGVQVTPGLSVISLDDRSSAPATVVSIVHRTRRRPSDGTTPCTQ